MLTVHDRRETYSPHVGWFRGLRFRVEGTPPPRALLGEAAIPRIRVRLERPRLWARLDRSTGHDYTLLWPTGPLPSLAVLPPITAAELRAAPPEIDARWWAHWARWTLDALCGSSHSPLHEGEWLLEPVERVESGDLRAIDPERFAVCSSQGGLFVSLAEPDDARTEVWRKRARHHPAPPIVSLVLGWGGGADLDVVLDGHCRLFGRRLLRLVRLHEEQGGVPLDGATWDHEVRRELERRGDDPSASELVS